MSFEIWAFLGSLAMIWLGFVLGWAYYGGTIAELRRQLIDVNQVDKAMLVSIAGHGVPQYDLADFSFQPGAVVELHDTLAAAWIEAGHAEKVSARTPVADAPTQEGA